MTHLSLFKLTRSLNCKSESEVVVVFKHTVRHQVYFWHLAQKDQTLQGSILNKHFTKQERAITEITVQMI